MEMSKRLRAELRKATNSSMKGISSTVAGSGQSVIHPYMSAAHKAPGGERQRHRATRSLAMYPASAAAGRKGSMTGAQAFDSKLGKVKNALETLVTQNNDLAEDLSRAQSQHAKSLSGGGYRGPSRDRSGKTAAEKERESKSNLSKHVQASAACGAAPRSELSGNALPPPALRPPSARARSHPTPSAP